MHQCPTTPARATRATPRPSGHPRVHNTEVSKHYPNPSGHSEGSSNLSLFTEGLPTLQQLHKSSTLKKPATGRKRETTAQEDRWEGMRAKQTTRVLHERAYTSAALRLCGHSRVTRKKPKGFRAQDSGPALASLSLTKDWRLLEDSSQFATRSLLLLTVSSFWSFR